MILCDGSFSSTASDCMYRLQRAIPRSGGGQGHLWLPWTRQKNMEVGGTYWFVQIIWNGSALSMITVSCFGTFAKSVQGDIVRLTKEINIVNF